MLNLFYACFKKFREFLSTPFSHFSRNSGIFCLRRFLHFSLVHNGNVRHATFCASIQSLLLKHFWDIVNLRRRNSILCLLFLPRILGANRDVSFAVSGTERPTWDGLNCSTSVFCCQSMKTAAYVVVFSFRFNLSSSDSFPNLAEQLNISKFCRSWITNRKVRLQRCHAAWNYRRCHLLCVLPLLWSNDAAIATLICALKTCQRCPSSNRNTRNKRKGSIACSSLTLLYVDCVHQQ